MLKVNLLNGKKVVDANYRMALVIEKRDVEAGKSKEPDACAAAVACVRQMDALSAHVFLTRTYVEFPKRWLRFMTPASLRTEIVSFDRGNQFATGTYYLSPLCQSLRPTGKARSPATKRNSYPKKRAKSHKLEGVRRSSDMHHMFTHGEK